MTNKKDNISLFKIFKRLLPFTLKACPVYMSIYSLIRTLLGIFLALNIVAMGNFFDAVSNYILEKITFTNLLIQLLLLFGCIIAIQILNGVNNVMYKDLLKKVSGKIMRKLNIKSSKIDPLYFENPLFLDDINKAKEGVKSAMSAIDVLLGVVSVYIPYFIIVGIYFYSLNPLLILSIFIIFVPVVVSQILKIKLFAKLEDKVAPLRREYQYYEKCIMDREYFKETRLLGCFRYFKNLYKNALSMINDKTYETQKKSVFIEFRLKLLTLSSYIVILFLLVKCVLNKSISIGALGAIFGSLDMLIGMMEEVICWNIGSVFPKLGTINNLMRFLDMDEYEGKHVNINKIPEINIKDVSFIYPGNTKNSLSNISFNIKPGETVAIVGENGSGKSTLVRLIIGIYSPTEGKIEFNGYDTRFVSKESLFKNISSVFQKFQRYKMTLNENISISDTSLEAKPSRINKASNKASLTVSNDIFPKGYETMLSREFNGVDLSGGQWQKVAIARGFYKSHNMIILDEPTASIDPIEETKLYKKFKEMSYGKTSIIVTHRLGSAKIADKIVVLDKGRITQIGTHDDLINIDGKYKELYSTQSKWYA